MKLGIATILLIGALFAQSPNLPKTADLQNDYSGMYSFLSDGEFVRINVEGNTRLTGFISRRSDAGKSMFIDHFFEKAEIHDRELRFSTVRTNGVWFDFSGSIVRGQGKTRNARDYYEIKGTLLQHSSNANHAAATKTVEVTFHSLPQEICD
jgi:hypothetical protein